MSEQFVSVITNEAMSRICYDGGWDLKPYMFFISQTDVLEQFSEQEIFDKEDNIKPEIFEYLKDMTTEKMDLDYSSGAVWYSANFSSVSKANTTTLTHHINIPGDIAIDASAKEIRTIYFIYQDKYGQSFLYALARSNGVLLFEQGVSQSFFFNFTVTNSQTQDMTEFILNYSCAHEIEDHNTTFGPEIHSNLVARDGSRDVTEILNYDAHPDFSKAQGRAIVDKQYVDTKAQQLEDSLTKVYRVTAANGNRVKPSQVTVVDATAVPSGFKKQTNELLLYTAPAFPYVPYNTSIAGTSRTFTNGGIVMCTSATNVTVFAGQAHTLVFSGFVGILPVMPGTTVTTNKNAYFVDN
jgi:hypothetical protein